MSKANEPACHILHYLQMATEKLGKAYFLSGGTGVNEAQNSHLAFAKFLRLVARNGKLQKMLGMRSAQLRAHVRQLLPIAHSIEKLAPALAEGSVNTEYPWQSADGEIKIPIHYDFALSETLHSPSGRSLLELVKVIFDNFSFLQK
ncbi:MAG: hypothetical protein ONB46_19245 [candidate division KSB1 bacterium]|nr:hypothetical protein [candidate division KSB1 bacterium]MDZ7368009.1 hypothetical protein [candidate division KSB1 bacterium]MDZ7405632.1 hypothetical protein [candidate division KSB1 bacterium]